MLECRSCGEPFYGDTDHLGARCPRCREPLYERPGPARRRPESAEEPACTVHPQNLAAGTCERCGNYLCRVCRTLWNDRAVCLACAERALETHEARPEEVRAHRRQAILAVVFGVSAWALVLLSGLLVAVGQGGGPTAGLVVLAALIILASFLPSLFGVGQGAAAVRARGDHMILATCGLVLSGLHLGGLVGLFLFGLWGQ